MKVEWLISMLANRASIEQSAPFDRAIMACWEVAVLFRVDSSKKFA